MVDQERTLYSAGRTLALQKKKIPE